MSFYKGKPDLPLLLQALEILDGSLEGEGGGEGEGERERTSALEGHVARACMLAGAFHHRLGQFSAALPYHQRALEIARRQGPADPITLYRALTGLGICALRQTPAAADQDPVVITDECLRIARDVDAAVDMGSLVPMGGPQSASELLWRALFHAAVARVATYRPEDLRIAMQHLAEAEQMVKDDRVQHLGSPDSESKGPAIDGNTNSGLWAGMLTLIASCRIQARHLATDSFPLDFERARESIAAALDVAAEMVPGMDMLQAHVLATECEMHMLEGTPKMAAKSQQSAVANMEAGLRSNPKQNKQNKPGGPGINAGEPTAMNGGKSATNAQLLVVQAGRGSSESDGRQASRMYMKLKHAISETGGCGLGRFFASSVDAGSGGQPTQKQLRAAMERAEEARKLATEGEDYLMLAKATGRLGFIKLSMGLKGEATEIFEEVCTRANSNAKLWHSR